MKILCIGDSLTYGYGVERTATWCSLASRISGHEFLNHGVNGALTGEMREQEIFGDELFVMGGLNNLFMGMPVAIPLTDIRMICKQACCQHIRPCVGIPMQISPEVSEAWCDGPVDIVNVRTAYAEYAEELLLQCKQDGIRFIDFRPLISPSELSFDGIHLNRQGHLLMAEAIAACWPLKTANKN